jgi:MoxR-like ATPase
MTYKNHIQSLLKALNRDVFEKEEVIALSLLSAMASESIFLLGAPGVAKSLIARRLKFAFSDATSFDYLMNRFSTPDEIFGPVSISKLKDEDKYERIVTHYLPDATIVFLDEIWKAGPSIQNALLTVLNEKIYRNGEQEIQLPMKALIAASNELPAEGEGLEALWDRFLVRFVVENVQQLQNFYDMISKPLQSYADNIPSDLKITDAQYADIQGQIDSITIPSTVFNVIHIVRHYINEYNNQAHEEQPQMYISDRRWRKIVRLLRTSALLNDRKAVDLMDCFLMQHCLWNEKEQIETVGQFVKEAIQKHGYKLDIDVKDLKEQIAELDTETQEDTHFIRDTSREEPFVFEGFYYEVAGITTENKYISINNFNALTTTEKAVYLPYLDIYHGDLRNNLTFKLQKGVEKFTLIVNGQTYKLRTENTGDKRQITRKPHKTTEKHWDDRIKTLLDATAEFKEKLTDFRAKQVENSGDNLFVKSSNSAIIEAQLMGNQGEIEKLEVDIKRVQHYYKNLKHLEVVIEDDI